jgi:Flp pilus assembly protein CpaB
MFLALGVGMFVVAAGAALLATRGDDNDSNDPPVVTVAPAAQGSEGGGDAPAAANIRIPDGKEAVAIQVGAVPGMAGYAKVNDRVNVYGTFKDRQPNSQVKGPPIAKLVLSNVQVLAVSNAGANVTYVLAVNADEAEKVIYLSSFETVWLTLTRDGAPAVGGTPGHNATNAA